MGLVEDEEVQVEGELTGRFWEALRIGERGGGRLGIGLQ
jgi:hypothetical protein